MSDVENKVDDGSGDDVANSGSPHGYPPLNHIGVHFSLGREIVREQVVHTSSIWCEWTDGYRGCCEVWKHESPEGISVRDALDLATKDGWVVVCGKPVCGCHIDDPEDTDISDLSAMRKYFGG